MSFRVAGLFFNLMCPQNIKTHHYPKEKVLCWIFRTTLPRKHNSPKQNCVYL